MRYSWLIALVLMAAFVRADEAAVRAALTKSLGYLAREGDRWMEDKDCISCHHLPELLWSHREAAARGFSVDQAKFNEWLAWADERANQKQHGLEQASLMLLAMPGRAAKAHLERVTSEQKPDGSWKPGNQFIGMQKRGEPDAVANALRLHLIALQSAAKPSEMKDKALARCAPLLQKKETPTTVESLVFRLDHARQSAKTEEAEKWQKTILQHQRGDGGWSSMIGANMSDPLATGQVLWALRDAAPGSAAAVATAKAQSWLLGTQSADGAWPIDITHISKIDRSAPAKAKSFKDATDIYRYWAAGWAAIGLLQSLPVVAH